MKGGIFCGPVWIFLFGYDRINSFAMLEFLVPISH